MNLSSLPRNYLSVIRRVVEEGILQHVVVVSDLRTGREGGQAKYKHMGYKTDDRPLLPFSSLGVRGTCK